MELYIKIQKEELAQLQGKVFFEEDPYIDPFVITSGRCEYFRYNEPQTQDELDAEVEAVMDVIREIKELAPSSKIAYVSGQDEGSGWIMSACAFENEKGIREKEDFCPNSDFASPNWFNTMRKKTRLRSETTDSSTSPCSVDGFEFDENGTLLKYTGKEKNVVIPEGVEEIEWCAFFKCAKIKSVILPASLRTIGTSAFEGCSNLTKICIPANVIKINNWAFRNCENLEAVEIDNVDINFGAQVFGGCPKLLNTDGYVVVNGRAVVYEGTTEHLEAPLYAVDIAFARNETIRSIVIPEGVTEIKESAFSGCSKLESVQLPQSLKYIGERAFSGCSKLESVQLPQNLEYIGKSAFSYCGSLKEIIIPQGVKAIGTDAFASCSKLTSVQISNETELCQSFSRCEGLADGGRIVIAGKLDYYSENKRKKIVIPKTVKIIEDNVLKDCKGLEELHIPASVESIGRLPEGITIYGKAGSFAEEYAKEKGIPFVVK